MAQIPRAKETAFIIVGGGTDAPGWALVPDGHGGWKIVRVPGWNPEQMVELGAALTVVAAGGRIKNPKVSKVIVDSAAELVASEIGNLVAGAKLGAGNVVVIAAH
jgi:hypothetical protein